MLAAVLCSCEPHPFQRISRRVQQRQSTLTRVNSAQNLPPTSEPWYLRRQRIRFDAAEMAASVGPRPLGAEDFDWRARPLGE